MTVSNLTPPTISGTARQGQVLTTSDGTWDFDLEYLTYAYQWMRCDAVGDNCVDIAGATGKTYTLTAADVGSTIVSEVTATEHATPPGPSGYYWKGDFAGDAQDFSAFDTHDIRFTTFTDPIIGSTKDAVIVNKPVGSRYPGSNYSCRIICNNDLPSNSSTGQTVNLWEPGAYGSPWVRGNTVWCRVFLLLPDGTNPTYPGEIAPVGGDGVSSSWHVFVEWHKNDGVGAPGPTSTKLEIGWGQGGPSLMFKPLGGLYGSLHGYYLYETDQVQDETNGPYADPDDGPPIGGNTIALQFNHWYDLLWRWKLDPNPAVGEIDWYVDGNLRVSGNFGNMFQKSDGSVPGLSFQAGLYRNYQSVYPGTTDDNEHVYIGPMLVGPTRASVGA